MRGGLAASSVLLAGAASSVLFAGAVASVLFAGAGCEKAAPPRPVPAPVVADAHPTAVIAADAAPVADAALPADMVVVWSPGDAPQSRVFRVAADGAVTDVASGPGIVVVADNVAYRFAEKQKQVTLIVCPHLAPPEGAPLPTADILAADLEQLGADTHRILVPFPDTEGVASIDHSISLDAQVGPYLFLTEGQEIYACGAHGNVLVRAKVADVTASTAAPVLTKDERARVLATLGPVALKRLHDKGVADLGADADYTPDKVDLVSIEPSWISGHLRVGVRFAADACYACGDGEWSSYTRSVVVPMKTLPRALLPYATEPAAVTAIRRTHPDMVIGGYSLLSVPWTEIPGLTKALKPR